MYKKTALSRWERIGVWLVFKILFSSWQSSWEVTIKFLVQCEKNWWHISSRLGAHGFGFGAHQSLVSLKTPECKHQ